MADFSLDDLTLAFKKALRDVDTSPFRRGESSGTESKKRGNAGHMLDSSMSNLNRGFKSLHGNTRALEESFQQMVGWAGRLVGLGVLAGAVDDLVSGIKHTVTTYQKLSDIGQNFGGSMLVMQQQAGAAGLTLEEFSRTLTRNSKVAAVFANSQNLGATSLGQFERSMRDSIKQFGYYGMSLSEVSDMSADYAENLRITGLLARSNKTEEQGNFADLMTNVTALADVTGKSREEIMKGMTEASHAGSLAAYLALHANDKNAAQQAQAASVMTATFAAINPELAQFAGNMVDLRQVPYALSEGLGAELNKAGANDMIGFIQQVTGTVRAGEKIDPRAIGERMKQLAALDQQKVAMLNDPKLSAMFADMANMNWDNWAKDLQKQNDPLTKAAMDFETTLHQITGDFRTEFYSGLVKSVYGPDATHFGKGFQDSMAKLKDQFASLSTSLGMVAGDLAKIAVAVLPWLITLLNGLTETVNGLNTAIDKATGGFLGSGWSTLISLGAVIGGLYLIFKKFLGGALTMRRNLSKRMGEWSAGVFGGRLGRSFGGKGAVAGAADELGKIRGSSCLEPLYVYVCNEGFKGGGGGGGGGGGFGGGGTKAAIAGEEEEVAAKGVKGLLRRSSGAIKSLAHGWGGALLDGAGFLFINGALDWVTSELQSSGTIGDTTGGILTDLVNPALSMGLTKVGSKLGKKALSSVSGRLMSGLSSSAIGSEAATTAGLATDLGEVGAGLGAVGEVGAGLGVAGEIATGGAALLAGATAPVWLVPALIAAGVGIAGVGAYELLKNNPSSSPYNTRTKEEREARYNAMNPPPTAADYNSRWADANEIQANLATLAPPPDDHHAPASHFNTRTAAGREAQAKYNAEHLAALKAIKDNTDATKNNTGYGAVISKQMANDQAKKNPSWWQVALQAIN